MREESLGQQEVHFRAWSFATSEWETERELGTRDPGLRAQAGADGTGGLGRPEARGEDPGLEPSTRVAGGLGSGQPEAQRCISLCFRPPGAPAPLMQVHLHLSIRKIRGIRVQRSPHTSPPGSL